MEIKGSALTLSPVAARLPNGTGVPDIAKGYDDPAPPAEGGAFWEPRTVDDDPRGSVQRAPVFRGGRFVVWSGPIRFVSP